jgi:hypothetical protein
MIEARVTVCKIRVFRAVDITNVFWDIKTQFVPHRRHVTSPFIVPSVNSM